MRDCPHPHPQHPLSKIEAFDMNNAAVSPAGFAGFLLPYFIVSFSTRCAGPVVVSSGDGSIRGGRRSLIFSETTGSGEGGRKESVCRAAGREGECWRLQLKPELSSLFFFS